MNTIKEIDFIPQWYKAGQKRQCSYRKQYIVIIAIFAVMVVWSFTAGLSVSRAVGKVNDLAGSIEQDADFAAEHEQLKTILESMQEKSQILEKLDPRITYSCVLGELAFLVGDNIIFSSLDIRSEVFQPLFPGTKSSRVPFVRTKKGDSFVLPETDSRFKISIAGIAAQPSDVAELISRLESSPYFCQVMPGFSKNVSKNDVQVTNFEIDCFLANYVQKKQGAK